MSKHTDPLERAKESTAQIAYVVRAFQLWGVVRSAAHQLGQLMETNTSADKNTVKFCADLYVYADEKCALCSQWLDDHGPQHEDFMAKTIGG